MIQHDSFEEAWSYVKHNANSLISSYCEINTTSEVGVYSHKDEEKKSGTLRLHFPDTGSYVYFAVKEENSSEAE